MKLVEKLEVIQRDSLWSLVFLGAGLPTILLKLLFPFFVSLIIRLLQCRAEVTRLWDRTDWQAISLNTLALLA